MKNKRFLFLTFILVILASLAYVSLTDHSKISAADRGAIPALFSDAKESGTPDRTNDRTIVRQRPIRINLGLLMKADGSPKPDNTGLNVNLNLFDDVTLTAVIDRTESVSAGGYSFIGRVAGVEASSVILSVYDGIMSGNITVPGGSYQVRYVSEGVHAAYQIDPSAFPREAPPIPVDNTGKDSSRNSIPASGGDTGATIDVLVAYTPATRSAAGGTSAMQSLVNLAVTETNTGYSNSGVNQRVRLVYSTEVAYTESSDTDAGWSTDLSRLQSKTDGNMDSIHTLRDQYGADLVVLIAEKSYYCGLGYMMSTLSGTFESNAFCVVARICATGKYSFAHEMGHNMGSNHDHANAGGSSGVYPYSFGYQSPSKAWRSIMAYDCAGTSCTRINYWSNPGLIWNATNELMGVSGTGPTAADNRSSLNNTAFTVANFRQAVVATTTSTTTATTIATTTTVPPSSSGTSGGGGCFIATAAYGSYLDPHVVVLRDFRDRYLQTNQPGQYFVQWYYDNSPPVAELIRKNEAMKIMTRVLLTPVILAIQFPYFFLFIFIIFSLAMISLFVKLERQRNLYRKSAT